MKFGVKSDKGMVREINEDYVNVVTESPELPQAFIIADGMGGHNAGEIASKMAVDCISGYIKESLKQLANSEEISKSIEEMMQKANLEVYDKSKESEANYGMGTTLIVAVLYNGNIHIGHIGDSRAYLIREEKIERITTDHSYIEELIKNGSINREEAEKHPKKNLITRALGCSEDMLVDSYICEAREKDIFMLCTDGLTNKLSEAEIMDILLNNEDPQDACNELVRRSNEKGGEDNISVIVVKI